MNIKRTNQQAARAAILFHEQLFGKRRSEGSVYLPTYTWNNIQRIQRQVGMARQHGWHGAAKRLSADLATAVAECHRELETTLRGLQTANRGPCLKVSVADIYHDLIALKNEFADVAIDLKEHEISATTDKIVLKDIQLGRFQIRLEWPLVGRVRHPYRVVALDPHPATKGNDITHPHVQDEQLCEGDGRPAIAAALAEGRLLDFFLLVSQVLHTYGSGSPYAHLEHWDDISCSDCGGYVHKDRRHNCYRCQVELCGGCSRTCGGCKQEFCDDCLCKCSACGRAFCSRCLKSCHKCGQRFCDQCRKDRFCVACDKQIHPQQPQEEPQNDAPDESPGEAACLAGQAG